MRYFKIMMESLFMLSILLALSKQNLAAFTPFFKTHVVVPYRANILDYIKDSGLDDNERLSDCVLLNDFQIYERDLIVTVDVSVDGSVVLPCHYCG